MAFTGYAQSSPAVIPRMQERLQSKRRGEFPAVLKTDPTNTEFTIGQSKQPQFFNSIDELAAFSAAVDAFKRQYDELQKHMDFIENAIDSNLKSNGIDMATSSSLHTVSPLFSPPSNNTSGETTAIVGQSPQEPAEIVPETSNKAEGQRFCELMCSRSLRKYIYTNISDRAKLIEEIPAALKFAKEPEKFVLECIGKFYLQGRKAFAKDSPMIPARQVSLLILESFLLMPYSGEEKNLNIKIESSVKDEAETAAVAWRKRLRDEGGLAVAEQMDARGLLLLIACFGVPSIFGTMDLLNLIQKSGSSEIMGALRRSPFLIPKISGIIESSIKCGKHIEALELAYTFAMENKFSASSVLTSFVKMRKELFEREKRRAHTPMASKEAIEKHLAALSSVMQFLETHKLDPEKQIPELQIKKQMVNLAKDTLQVEKQMEEEARSISLMEEAVLTKRLYNQQMKRPRLSEMEIPPVASSSYSTIYHDRSFLIHRDEDSDEISALVNSYLGPSSSFPHRSTLRRSPEYMAQRGLGRSVSDAYEHIPLNLYPPVRRRYSPVHGQRLPREYSDSPPIHEQQQIPFGLTDIHHL